MPVLRLTKSLEIEIVDVEPQESSEPHWKTQIVGTTYTNADHQCRISAPAAGWKLVDRSKPGAVTVQFQADEKFDRGEPLVHFVAFALPGGLSPAVVVNARKAQFQSRYKAFKVLADEKTTVGDDEARRFVFQRQDPKSAERTIKTTEYVWAHGGSAYLLNLIAEETVHDAILPQVEAVLKSFEVLAAAEPAASE